MTMLGRRGLLKAAGLMPAAGLAGKHKREPDPVGWGQNQFQLLIVNAQAGGFSGEFVYSSGPAFGNLIASSAAAAGTDPYGNAYVAGNATYFNTGAGYQAVQSNQGVQQFLTAPAASGPWAVRGIVQGGQNGASANGVEIGPFLTLPEQSSAPVTPLVSGTLYVDSTGHLHYLGPGGTNTTLAGP